MSIAQVVTRGYGSFGTIPKVVTSGFTIGTVKPIFTRIVDKVTFLINEHMTQANGFSQDYGSINVYDPTARTYPAVFYDYPDEDSLDEDLQVINRNSEETAVTFRVVSGMVTSVDLTHENIIADFNKLFAEFQDTLKNEGLIDYRYFTTVKNYDPVDSYPVVTETTYIFKYRRVMDDIYSVDSSGTNETFSGSAWSTPTPVWSAIMAGINTKIGTMTIVNGYVFDYGSINEYEPDSRSYPAMFISYPEETGVPEEDNELYKYNCNQDMEIKIIGETQTDLDKTMFIYRSDFNKMFAANLDYLSGLGMETYEFLGSTYLYQNVKAYPIIITLTFNLVFNRQKKNPYLT